MKRLGIALVVIGAVIAVGCASGEVSQGGALDKHKQIEDATKKSTGGQTESRD